MRTRTLLPLKFRGAKLLETDGIEILLETEAVGVHAVPHPALV